MVAETMITTEEIRDIISVWREKLNTVRGPPLFYVYSIEQAPPFYGVLTLPDTETDKEADRKWVI